MATIILPATLAERTGTDELALDGNTVRRVLAALEARHPGLAGWVLDERGALRQHVHLFLNDRRAGLDDAVADSDRLFVVQAISGGAPDRVELLAATGKGLVVLRGERGAPLEVAGRAFAGQEVEIAVHDPRSGRTLASVTHGQFGPRLFWARDPVGEWTQAEGPAFPADVDAAVRRIWAIVPGEAEGEVWAGVAPAALFRSTDGGLTWALNRGLWNVEGRPGWEGGAGGLCLHSICPWPGDPQRLAVGISAAGVWVTADGGRRWRWGVEGLVPRYVPLEARRHTTSYCVHAMRRSPVEPQTIYMQFHGGVYRSDDGGLRWTDIGAGLPADFGFPIEIDPRDPDRAFAIPLVADVDRVTVDGRVRVFATDDRGASWTDSSTGLPQQDAYLTILRQAFCHDGRDPLGLYFGARSGEVFASADGGRHWHQAAGRLPPVLGLRFGRQ